MEAGYRAHQEPSANIAIAPITYSEKNTLNADACVSTVPEGSAARCARDPNRLVGFGTWVLIMGLAGPRLIACSSRN